jgi:hypothetical protein
METQFLTNQKGRKTSVLLSIKHFEQLLEAYEELEDIKAYDKAKAEKQEFVSWDSVKAKILNQ